MLRSADRQIIPNHRMYLSKAPWMASVLPQAIERKKFGEFGGFGLELLINQQRSNLVLPPLRVDAPGAEKTGWTAPPDRHSSYRMPHNPVQTVRTKEMNHKSFRRLRMTASSLRLIPHLILLLYSSRKHLIEADLARWAELLLYTKPQTRSDLVKTFITLMTFLPEFRNLFYLRAGKKFRVLSWMCRGLADLDIASGSIGPGLFIQHGNSTFVSAVSIGENCWIGRHVVVGYSNDTDIPTIGDNVRIFAGAKIIGKVTIGNNATIGLNTVVLDDVPAHATVFGVPGRVIWKACTKV